MRKKLHYRDVFGVEPCAVINVKARESDQDCEITSFVPGRHYADNFGKQWARFRDVQIDSVNGTTISRDYLETLIGGPIESLSGKTVLEVGAGAGRFTEHFVEYAEQVVAIDLSEAIFVNVALGADNIVPVQANLLEMPPMKMQFDLVYCRGVLQHTPDPIRSISQLHRWVNPGGVVAFDIYPPGILGKFGAKYLWRPVIQRIFTYESFLSFLERHTAKLLRLRWKLKPFLPGLSRKLLDFVFPVYDYKDLLDLTEEQLIDWAKLDTLDAFFAHFDNPMAYDTVLKALGDMGAHVLSADREQNFFRSTWSSTSDFKSKHYEFHAVERPAI